MGGPPLPLPPTRKTGEALEKIDLLFSVYSIIPFSYLFWLIWIY
jgi:hypothetical protein